jgi:hypothetical protein
MLKSFSKPIGAIICLLLGSCGPTYNRLIMLEEVQLDPLRDGIVVGVIELERPLGPHDSSNTTRDDIKVEQVYEVYRETLNEYLVDSGIAYEPGKNKIVTNITILGYKEGNAFVRWLTPVGGDSRIQVQATLEIDGQIIGGVESQKTIAWGGAYSISGWRMVIRWSATEVGQNICRESFRDNSYKHCT